MKDAPSIQTAKQCATELRCAIARLWSLANRTKNDELKPFLSSMEWNANMLRLYFQEVAA
jgi:hypothetical protein